MADGGLAGTRAAATGTSFAGVYRRHFDAVVRHLRRMGVADEALEDAAQEVFVVVHRKLHRFEGRARLGTWLFAIAHHVALRHRRTRERSDRKVARIAVEWSDRTTLGPDEAVAQRQAEALLAAFLDTLPDEQRGAFVLGELEQLSRPQLGEALGVSPNTAYSRLRLARARFSEAFGAETIDPALLLRWRAATPETARRDAVWAGLLLQLPELAIAPALAATGGLAVVGPWIMWTVAAAAAVTISAVATGGSAVAPPSPRPPAPSLPVPATVASAPVGAELPRPSLIPTSVARSSPPTRAAAPVPSRPIAGTVTASAASAIEAPEADDLAAELADLAQARATLRRGDAAGALAGLEAHAARWPGGALALDREVLRIDALCAAGRVGPATEAIAAFLRDHGDSAQAAHVRAACSDH